MPRKVRLNKLSLMTRGADTHKQKESMQTPTPDEGQESNFRILRALLPPIEAS